MTTMLPNPGAYDLALHGPNGFFRHFAGSRETVVVVESRTDSRSGRLRVRLAVELGHDGRRRGRGRDRHAMPSSSA